MKGVGNSYSFGDYGYDPRIARRLSIDPKFAEFPNISSYSSFEGNPIFFNDKLGENAGITIKGDQITVSTIIYIYGSGATKKEAASMQTNIMRKWGGGNHTYKDPSTGKIYNVKFDVTVTLHKGNNNPDVNIPEIKSQRNDNFVEIVNARGRSHVHGERGFEVNNLGGLLITEKSMQTGVFYIRDKYGRESDASDHEVGHLFGLSDKYIDVKDAKGRNLGSKTIEGWKGNIMGSADGEVDQRNIDEVVKSAVESYNKSYSKGWNNCSFCPGTIEYKYTKTDKDHEPRIETTKTDGKKNK